MLESDSRKESRCVSVKTRAGKRKTSSDRDSPLKRKQVSASVSGSREGKASEGKVDTSKRQKTAEPEPRLRGTKRKISEDDEYVSGKRQKVSELEQRDEEATFKQTSIEDFEARYHQLEQLGEGGQGSVYAGYRRADNFPVAIKHIPREKVKYEEATENSRALPLEVAIMLKMASGAEGSEEKSAAISLLDHYLLDQELILVLEHPVPCVDLLEYLGCKGTLQEEEAKLLMKQLIEAAKELKSKNVFHQDIKLENILIETSSDVPRLRLIDFGLSCFAEESSSYSAFCGTLAHIPPEYLEFWTYSAGPTTVWQLGVVLYEMLHPNAVFETTDFLVNNISISEQLSPNSQDMLHLCLARDPQQRASVEQLQLHPWIT